MTVALLRRGAIVWCVAGPSSGAACSAGSQPQGVAQHRDTTPDNSAQLPGAPAPERPKTLPDAKAPAQFIEDPDATDAAVDLAACQCTTAPTGVTLELYAAHAPSDADGGGVWDAGAGQADAASHLPPTLELRYPHPTSLWARRCGVDAAHTQLRVGCSSTVNVTLCAGYGGDLPCLEISQSAVTLTDITGEVFVGSLGRNNSSFQHSALDTTIGGDFDVIVSAGERRWLLRGQLSACGAVVYTYEAC